jgi:hypothetical protein
MVTLTNNELHFSFPANSEEFDRLVQAKQAEVFRRIMAEDRREAVNHLFAEDLRYRRAAQPRNGRPSKRFSLSLLKPCGTR